MTLWYAWHREPTKAPGPRSVTQRAFTSFRSTTLRAGKAGSDRRRTVLCTFATKIPRWRSE
jgi:hypothetical protein